MLTLVRLADGNYRLTVDYHGENASFYREWTFAAVEKSDSEPTELILRIVIA